MSKKPGDAGQIAIAIDALLKDETHGRRSVRWLAERVGVSYQTLQHWLAKEPARIPTGVLLRIADALSVPATDLYAAAYTSKAEVAA